MRFLPHAVRSSRTEPATKAPPPRDSDSLQADQPALVASVLSRLARHKSPLSVSLPGKDDTYISAVLTVSLQGRWFLLDELNPPAGHQRVEPGMPMRVRGFLDGVDVSFDAPVADIDGRSGIAFYRLPFPERIHYHQRRHEHRVPLGAGVTVTVHLDIPDAALVDGRLLDISSGGIGARIQSRDETFFKKGIAVPDCTIELPGRDHIITALEIGHVDPGPTERGHVVGGRFSRLSGRQRQQIRRFAAAIDRQAARRRSRLT